MAPPFDATESRMRIQDLLGQNTDSLRSNYYDYLSSAFDENKADIRPDSNASLVQGVLPAILAGIFTKGKALAFAGEPLTNVLKQQTEIAKNKATLDLETNLKKAGLIGDELTRRDKITTDEWERVSNEQLKRDLANQVSTDRRYEADMRHEDRQMMAGAVASNRAAVDSDRDENRRMRQENQDRDDQANDTVRVEKSFSDKLKARKVPERLAAWKSANAMLDADNNIAAEQIRGLLVGMRGDNRKSNLDILRAIPESFRGKAQAVLNFIDSGTTSPIQPGQKEALRAVLNVYKKEILDDAHGAKKSIVGLADNLAPTLKKMNKLESVLSVIGSDYGIDNTLGADSTDGGMSREEMVNYIRSRIKK